MKSMKEIWNNGNKEQRSDLLQSIYHNDFFSYLCDKDFDNLIPGVRRRLERLYDVYKAR